MKKHIIILLLFSLLCAAQTFMFLEGAPPASGAGQEVDIPGARVSFYKEENIMDARPYLKKKADGSEQVLAVILVQYQGIKILDLTNAASTNSLGTYSLPSRARLGSFTIAPDYPVDLNNDGLYSEREKKDLVFFSVLAEQLIVVVDITTPTAPVLFREIKVKDSGGMMDMAVVPDEHTLYVSDIDKGLILMDMTFTGKDTLYDDDGKRVVSTIGTTGSPRRGLTVNTDLNIAYVGQLKGGVDILKLGNPKLKLVYKDASGVYQEVSRIAPYGLKSVDNPDVLTDTVHVMAWLPGSGGDKVKADIWSLNEVDTPIIPAGETVKTFLKEVPLRQVSTNRLSRDYNVYISDPIRVTLLPNDSRDGLTLLSGHWLKAHLSESVSHTFVYLTKKNCLNIMDRKRSVPADLVDRVANFTQSVGEADKDKPNSPVNNPAYHEGVLLHSGEYVHQAVDLHIPGRGFDFAFSRTYRSQVDYSGPIGWSWDHNYNKRLVELPGGAMIYYDGSGRRERFDVDGTRGAYKAPNGWFVKLKRMADGNYRLIFPDRGIQFFDAYGRLKKIQDRNRNTMEFFYNIAGQMSDVMDTMGRPIHFEYYPFEMAADGKSFKKNAGRLKEIRDYKDRKVAYTYSDLTGALEEIKKEDSSLLHADRITKYKYTEGSDIKTAYNLISEIDGENRTLFTLAYDPHDAVATKVMGDATVGFDTGPDAATVTNGRNFKTQYTFNDAGQTESIMENGKAEFKTTFSYTEPGGLLASITYPEKNSVAYTYDGNNSSPLSRGNLLTLVESAGDRGATDSTTRTTTYTYDSWFNQVTSITHPNGLTVTFSFFDQCGNAGQKVIKAPEENPITHYYSYNKYGQLESVKTPWGTTTYDYFPEAAPGGGGGTRGGRQLDMSTGGYVKTVITPTFNKKFFQYDTLGNLIRSRDSSGATVQYQYNDFNEVTREQIDAPATSGSISGPVRSFVEYDYYKNGNVRTRKTTAGPGSQGQITSETYTYDIRNNVEDVTNNHGTTSFSHDANDNLTAISGPTSSPVSFGYNSRDMINSVTLGSAGDAALASIYGFTYDGNGNMETSTNPYGHMTQYAYDGFDRMKRVEDPLGNVSQLTWAKYGDQLTVARKNSAGDILRQTVKNHDPMGRLKSYNVILTDPEAPNNPGYSYAYENDGNKVTVTDWLGRQSVREQVYDGSVKTIKETDPAGNVVAYFVNEKGRGNLDRKKETVKLADGTVKTYETHYEYNAFGKVEKITDPQGLVSTFAYNGQGNLSRTVDAENNVVEFAYDNLGRKKTTTRYAANNGPALETHFTYNKANLLATIRDSKGNVTRYQYDARRRPRQVTYPDGSVQAYAYGKREVDGVLSRTTTETQRNGVTVETVYDVNNRVWKRFITSPSDIEGTSFETYTYDGLSRLRTAVNDGSTLEMKYDHLNRLTNELQNGQWTHYTYQDQADTHSLLQTFQYPSATETGGNGRVMERDFDILGRLSAIRDQAGDVHVAGFTYEGRGYRYHSKHYNNGDVINYAYTQGRRLQGKETKNKNSALINHYVYGYNNVGMKTYEQRNHDSGKGDVYAYDGVSRLTGVTFDAPDPTAADIPDTGKSWTASYDAVDNILSMVNVQEGKTKAITPQIPTNSVYEKLNQYATFNGAILSYDENGNTSRKGQLKFYYDYRNQLVRILDGIKTTQYTYDVMGRRIRKDVAGQVTNYFYSGNQVMEERDGSGNILKQYIYGNGIDELLRIDVYENGTVTSYFVHTNAVGSVTAITDADGNIVERVSYDAFGNASFTDAAGNPIAASAIGNEILFQGRRYDKESNLYYYRARHYDPVMGRFLQNDPTGYHDSMNLYQAFNMNGVNFVDPDGRLIILKIGIRLTSEKTPKRVPAVYAFQITPEMRRKGEKPRLIGEVVKFFRKDENPKGKYKLPVLAVESSKKVDFETRGVYPDRYRSLDSLVFEDLEAEREDADNELIWSAASDVISLSLLVSGTIAKGALTIKDLLWTIPGLSTAKAVKELYVDGENDYLDKIINSLPVVGTYNAQKRIMNLSSIGSWYDWMINSSLRELAREVKEDEYPK